MRSSADELEAVIQPNVDLIMNMILRKHRFLLGDLVLIFVSGWLSFFIRLGTGLQFHNFIFTVMLFSGLSLLVKLPIFHLFGIYRIYWKFIGAREIFKLLVGSIFSSAIFVLVLVGAIWLGLPLVIPRIVIGIDLILTTLFLFVYRKLAYLD